MNRAAPIAHLQAEAARHFGVPLRVITNHEMSESAIRARHVAMFLAVTALGKGPCEIGRRFKRDHSTVAHAVRKVANDPALSREAEALRDALA